MNLLLDTHILLWLIDDDSRLPIKAKELILNENNQLYVSSISLIEISIKHNKNSKLVPNSGNDIYHLCLQNDIRIMPIKAEHVAASETLNIKEDTNNDFFDRLLIAQAKSEKFNLLTNDKAMSHYDEDCILFV